MYTNGKSHSSPLRSRKLKRVPGRPFGGGAPEGRDRSGEGELRTGFCCRLAALTVGTASPEPGASAAGCGQDAGGYAYAGYQAASTAHGVRATITMLSIPNVGTGHVAAWIGIGGRESAPGGADSWLQAGIAALPGEEPIVYAEIVRPDRRPEFRTIAANVAVGQAYRLAVLETKQRPGWWRVWLNGSLVVEAIRLLGTVGGWKPIATAEAWNGEGQTCNSFAFRFQDVGLADARGGSWRPFSPGRRFLDVGYRLRRLEPSSSNGRVGASFAFEPSR